MAIFYTNSASFNSLQVTGSANITSTSGIALQLKSSGSTIFSISGSNGEIFNISDSTSTNLFSVANGSTGVFSIDNTNATNITGSLTVIGSHTITGSVNVSGSKTNTGRYGYVQVNASNASALITVSGSNTVGGTGYIDFLRVTNTSSSIATPTKTFRLNTVGDFEIISSNYTTSSLYVSDAGDVTLYGSLRMPRRPAFRIIGTGASIASGTIISGSAISVDFNQGGYYSTTTGKFTAPIAGLYQVNVVCRTAANNNSGINQIIVRKQLSGGGATTAQIMVEWAINTTANHMGGSSVVNLAVGDTLWVEVTGGTISFDGNDNFSAAYIG